MIPFNSTPPPRVEVTPVPTTPQALSYLGVGALRGALATVEVPQGR